MLKKRTANQALDNQDFQKGVQQQQNAGLKQQESTRSYVRFPKKRLVLGVGYIGSKFHGSQIYSDNVKVRTVEDELNSSLVKCGMISPLNAQNVHKVGFHRATRTDKGVHALLNYFSAKLMIDQTKELSEYKEIIQKQLPEDMRIFTIDQVGRKFDVKNSTSYRLYDYFLPTFLLKPLTQEEKDLLVEEIEAKKQQGQGKSDQKQVEIKIQTQENLEEQKKISEQQQQETKSQNQYSLPKHNLTNSTHYKNLYEFRLQPQKQEKIELFFKKFIGTHKFHNYTRKLSYKDPSSSRYILDMIVSKPIQLDGIEFVIITLKGQSFLYNQIRKMMGAIIQIMRWSLRDEFIDNTFQGNSIGIPVAPGEGLMLNRVSYQKYNQNKGLKNNNAIQVSQQVEKELDEFKMELIGIISQAERDNEVFKNWLVWLDCFIAKQSAF